jgi:hypothetical protein
VLTTTCVNVSSDVAPEYNASENHLILSGHTIKWSSKVRFYLVDNLAYNHFYIFLVEYDMYFVVILEIVKAKDS